MIQFLPLFELNIEYINRHLAFSIFFLCIKFIEDLVLVSVKILKIVHIVYRQSCAVGEKRARGHEPRVHGLRGRQKNIFINKMYEKDYCSTIILGHYKFFLNKFLTMFVGRVITISQPQRIILVLFGFIINYRILYLKSITWGAISDSKKNHNYCLLVLYYIIFFTFYYL